MTRRKTSKKANGHAGPAGRVNGHANGEAPATSSSRLPREAAAVEAPHNVATRGTAPPGRGGLSMESSAASDDARGASAAGAAHSAAACADRNAYAEAALPLLPGNGVYEAYEMPESAADAELAADGPGFVDAMNRLVNLYEVGKRFLQSEDDKIAQRTWEHLLQMKYGKGGPVEEPLRIDFEGMPRPVRTPSPGQS